MSAVLKTPIGRVAPPTDNIAVQWRGQTLSASLADADILVVDIGGTTIKCGGLRAGQLLNGAKRYATDTINTATPINALAQLLKDYITSQSFSPALLIVTVPGFIDCDFDHVLKASNVPALEGTLLATDLAATLDIPVVLERDAVLLLEGERRAGSAKGYDEVAGMFVGTGIGGAAISGGVPFRGAGWAMEIGHIRVPPVILSDNKTALSQQGHSLEQRSSGSALNALATQWQIPIDTIFTATAQDAERQLILNAIVADHAFCALATAACLSPRQLVLGGGVLELQGYPRERLLELIHTNLPNADGAVTIDVRFAELGWQAALHGALAMVERLSAQTAT